MPDWPPSGAPTLAKEVAPVRRVRWLAAPGSERYHRGDVLVRPSQQWAQAVAAYQMVAYMLVRKSNMALLDDDAISVIELRGIETALGTGLARMGKELAALDAALHTHWPDRAGTMHLREALAQ